VLSFSSPELSAELKAAFAREAIFGRRVETGLWVLLVGLDGADWDLINPMIGRGELPNLARLKRQGAWARLRSNVPTLSPLLWTTVATGKAPDRHGINDFLVVDPKSGRQVPINSTFRKARALWNILSDGGAARGLRRLVGHLACGTGRRSSDLRSGRLLHLQRRRARYEPGSGHAAAVCRDGGPS